MADEETAVTKVRINFRRSNYFRASGLSTAILHGAI